MKALLVLLLTAAAALAVTLEWDANTETNLAGYFVYHGPAPRDYTFKSETITNLTWLATNLPPTGRTYFAVTAFDTDGLESEYSDEVFWDDVTKSIVIQLRP